MSETHGRRAIRPARLFLPALALLLAAGRAGAEEGGLDSLLADEALRDPAPAESEPPAASPAEAAPETADAPPSPAGEPRGRTVEEIVVTAQKTEQNLREVPISMTVLGGDFLEQQNVSDFDDIAIYVPNTRIDAGAAFPDVRVRGFGSPLSNKGFEQSVGLLVDGVPYGRLIYYQMPLFDLERVEVLRGPQGTLVGKNTTAGVLSLVTRRPTDELSGRVGAEIGELDRRRLEGAVSGPIVPGLVTFRLSGVDETRDGYLRNTTADVLAEAASPIGFRDRRGIRAQLGLPNVLGASFVASYEKSEADLSAPWAFFRVLPKLESFFRQYDPDTDFDGENLVTSLDKTGFSTRDLDRFVLNGSYPFGAGWDLALVGEVSALDFRSAGDTDFTPVDMFSTRITDDNPQKTAELRVASPTLPGLAGLARIFGFGLGTSELTAGFFFQRREILDSELAIILNTSNVAAFAAAQNAPVGGPPPVPISPEIIAALDQAEDEEETTGFFEQRSDTWAPYGHLIWNVHGPWTIEHGMRFTWEKKTGSVANAFTRGTGIAFQALLAAEEFQEDLALDDFAFTPKEVLRYDWNDDIGFFASWARGFKAGGFNELSVNNDNNLTFDPEETNSWELGAKTRLLGGTARLDLTLFWQEVSNLQVFVVDPDAMLVSVRNAGEARSRGVEVDGSWLPTDWLTLVGALGYLDAKYLDFPFGTCAQDRPDSDGSGDNFCDLSGQQATHTPEWMATLTSSVRYPVGSLVGGAKVLPGFFSALDLTGGLTLEYNDVQFADQSNDFRMRQPSYVKLRASFGIADDARGWALGVTGENLTDVVTASQTRDVPLGGDNLVQVQEAPRLFFGTFRWVF